MLKTEHEYVNEKSNTKLIFNESNEPAHQCIIIKMKTEISVQKGSNRVKNLSKLDSLIFEKQKRSANASSRLRS